METHMLFLWLQMAFLAIQLGFIVGGLFTKHVNLFIIWACMFLSLLMFAGFLVYKP